MLFYGEDPRAVVEIRGIVKRFTQTIALVGVDFAVQAGEIHTLVGENGNTSSR